jgi:hypothetical protein
LAEKIEKSEEEILVSSEVVTYVLDFARSLTGYSSQYGGALSPMILNQRMKDISLNNIQATESTLQAALKNPKDSEIALQSFSQDFEISSQVYKKLLQYLGTMLDFGMTYSCINAKLSDYKSKKYQDDLDLLKGFVDRFDYKHEFSTVVQEMLRNEAFFCCPRLDSKQIVLQELPASPTWTLINGRWQGGLLFAFNLFWFLQPGVDLALYPDFFAQKYKEVWGDGKMKTYNPTLSPQGRGDSVYTYWNDVPVDVGWCWKMNPAMAARVPYYSGLFLDLIQQPLMRELQKNINMSVAARIILGEIPLLSKNTQGATKDQFSISAGNLGNFLSLVKAAIGDALKTAAVPLTNVQAIEFKSENEVYSSYAKNALALSGVNTNLIFTSDVRPNSIESQLSLNVDENQMLTLYPQFEQFMNYQINKLTKQFKFKIIFEGTQFYNDRERRFEKQMTLSSNGIVLPQKIASSIGMNPFEFQRQLEEAQASGWVDKLTPIISSFQQSGGNGGGRPTKSDGEISSSGEETRSSGGNIGRGGKK